MASDAGRFGQNFPRAGPCGNYVGGTAEAPLYTKQTVFAIPASDGSFKSVVGFTDAAPARLSK